VEVDPVAEEAHLVAEEARAVEAPAVVLVLAARVDLSTVLAVPPSESRPKVVKRHLQRDRILKQLAVLTSLSRHKKQTMRTTIVQLLRDGILRLWPSRQQQWPFLFCSKRINGIQWALNSVDSGRIAASCARGGAFPSEWFGTQSAVLPCTQWNLSFCFVFAYFCCSRPA